MPVGLNAADDGTLIQVQIVCLEVPLGKGNLILRFFRTDKGCMIW